MEWYRFITIGLALIATGVWIYFYYYYRQPAAIAPITWLLNVILYSVFKYIVGSDLAYYSASLTWANIVLVHGILLLLGIVIIFKDSKSWIFPR